MNASTFIYRRWSRANETTTTHQIPSLNGRIYTHKGSGRNE